MTPPDVVEAPDDTIAIRRLLLERARDRESALMARVHAWLTEPRAIALAWLVPVLYPWAVPAIFAGARSGEPLVRGVLVVLALLWACAGPAVAVLVMNGADDRFDRLLSRVRVLGAILATISPSLFMVVARGGRRLDWRYGAIAASALLALVPWPAPSGSTPRLRRLHRLSSALLGVFILGHIVNQSLGFVSVPSYAAMRGVMQLASEQSVSYVVIVTMVAMQILTGAAMGLKRLPTGAVARHLQAVSGWYLAVFLFAHVCSPYSRRGSCRPRQWRRCSRRRSCWPQPRRWPRCRSTCSGCRRSCCTSDCMPGSRRSGGSRNRLSGVGRTPLRWLGRWSSGPSACRCVEFTFFSRGVIWTIDAHSWRWWRRSFLQA